MIIRDNSGENLDSCIHNILNTTRLSLASKGLIIYLLTEKPDDYELSLHDLCIEHSCGETYLEKAIYELQQFGYIDYELIKTQDGTIDGKFTIYDTPHTITMIRYDFKQDLLNNLSKADAKFIKTYLNVNKHRKRDKKVSVLIDEMRCFSGVNWDNISEYINEIPYQEFLLTDYWLLISQYLKKEHNFICEDCGKYCPIFGKLNIHHETYENHGKELDADIMKTDLRVLCEECHEKRHELDLDYDKIV